MRENGFGVKGFYTMMPHLHREWWQNEETNKHLSNKTGKLWKSFVPEILRFLSNCCWEVLPSVGELATDLLGNVAYYVVLAPLHIDIDCSNQWKVLPIITSEEYILESNNVRSCGEEKTFTFLQDLLAWFVFLMYDAIHWNDCIWRNDALLQMTYITVQTCTHS